MQVIFIDGSNKPKNIVDSEWPVEEQIYTLKKVYSMALQPGVFGFELVEISLSDLSAPYEFYDSKRFAIIIGEEMQKEFAENIFKEEEVELEAL